MPKLSSRFADAVRYAADLHRGQLRKTTDIPYVAHLLGAASLALEHGASEDEAIAALLHDAIEDQSREGETRLEIRAQFGETVLAIVEGCTDAEGDAGTQKPAWRERKEAYIRHLGHVSPATRLVSVCDKLHNARAIVSDAHAIGAPVFDRFTGKREGTLWYYRALVSRFRELDAQGSHLRLVDELDRTVTEMERLGGGVAFSG